jgi:hypothetical protein
VATLLPPSLVVADLQAGAFRPFFCGTGLTRGVCAGWTVLSGSPGSFLIPLPMLPTNLPGLPANFAGVLQTRTRPGATVLAGEFLVN